MSSTINQDAILSGRISPGRMLSGKVAIPHVVLVDPYGGSYQVTPRVASSVVLPTSGKQMQQDVTVLQIPQFEVSNESGGKTLIIGEEYFNG